MRQSVASESGRSRNDIRIATPASRRNRGRGLLTAAIVVAVAAMTAGVARADFPSDVPDRFKIQAGGMDADFTTDASLSRSNGPVGVYVNFEDLFDLPVSEQDWNVQGFYRFSDKGYVDFGYVDFARESARIINQDVSWGNVTFLANAEVKVKFETAFPYAAYRHDFLQLEQVHISGSAGFSYLMLDVGLQANGNVEDSNGNPIAGGVNEEANVSFPVPLLGLQLDWRLTKHTVLGFYNRLLYINYGGFDGGIRLNNFFYEWYATRHFAIGGGIGGYKIDIRKYDDGNKTLKMQYDVFGPGLYLKMAF